MVSTKISTALWGIYTYIDYVKNAVEPLSTRLSEVMVLWLSEPMLKLGRERQQVRLGGSQRTKSIEGALLLFLMHC